MDRHNRRPNLGMGEQGCYAQPEVVHFLLKRSSAMASTWNAFSYERLHRPSTSDNPHSFTEDAERELCSTMESLAMSVVDQQRR